MVSLNRSPVISATSLLGDNKLGDTSRSTRLQFISFECSRTSNFVELPHASFFYGDLSIPCSHSVHLPHNISWAGPIEWV